MTTIRLVPVQAHYLPQVEFLYELLAERDPVANISHREMPSFEQHRKFVESSPYKAWYIVSVGEDPVGATYLTERNEIGISILRSHQRLGYSAAAVGLLMEMHPSDQFLANIAPDNARSIAMFKNLGFNLIQLTFEKRNAIND